MKLIFLALILFIRYQVNYNFANAWQDWMFRRPYSYGYTAARFTLGDRHFRTINRIHCIYNSIISVIGCNKDAVKCEAVRNLDNLTIKYDMLGIEYINNELKLYPKLFNESLFGTSISGDNEGNELSLRIYNQTNKSSFRGLFINDSMCFNRMVDLFRPVKPTIIVESTNSTKIAISGYVLGV